MSIPGFGNVVPIHFEVLALIGWRLSRSGSELIANESGRLEQMRAGHADLVRSTGHDFGYDLAKWRQYLLDADEEHGYRHPYAFDGVDRRVREAISDPEFLRLAAVLSSLSAYEAEAWDRNHAAKVDSERAIGRRSFPKLMALLNEIPCPFCGKPNSAFLPNCRHCKRTIK